MYADGDGNRVKSVVGATTTYFVGSHYESSGGVVTKYYLAGGTRLAMRKGSTSFYWLLSDHLSSTSKVATATGTLHSQQLYKAWGESRYTSGTLPTRYTYTGQYSYASDFGLLFYNARWYDPLLSRWASPDSIIPQNQGTLAWDRYAYGNNSPLNYTDPSGNFAFLATAVIGAAVGFSANYIAQTIAHLGQGMNLSEAVSSGNMDKRELVASTIGGAIAGLTMGVATTAIGAIGLSTSATSVATSIVGGAVSSVAGGQAEALTSAAFDQVVQNTSLQVTNDGRHLIQISPNWNQFTSDAQMYGFGNQDVMFGDAAVGAIVGFGVSGGQGLLNGTDELVLGAKPPSWVGPLSRAVDYGGNVLKEYFDERAKTHPQ